MFGEFFMRSSCRAARLWAIALATFMAVDLMASTPVRADLYWGLQLGDWSVPANWGGRLPTSSDTVYVVNGGTLTVTLPGELCGTLSLGGEGSGTVQMTGGGLSTNYQFVYSPVYNSGTGIFTQSGGTNSIAGCLYLGNNTGGSGTYSLSGSGLLSAGEEHVGDTGNGTFTQSGGTKLSATTTSLSRLQRRQQRHVQPQRQRPVVGTVRVRGRLRHGDLHAVRRNQQRPAISISATIAGSSGTYNLSGSGLLSTDRANTWAIPARGPSRSPAGPTVSARHSHLGYDAGSSGTYNLSGSGLLSAASEYIGYSGTGSFTQSGGTHSVSNSALYLGYNAGSSGTYNLSGSGLLSVPWRSTLATPEAAASRSRAEPIRSAA